jgi:hypothetical protein
MTDPTYLNYWKRKDLMRTPPLFPVRRWWATDGLCDVERVYFDAVRSAARLLDVGAGDLRVRRKLLAAGFAGTYDTQDIGTEFAYTYRSLDEVAGRYDAVLCLDVLEHLRLEDGLGLFGRLVGLLNPGGVLVVQTPNARCVRHPLGWDMTHVHVYNLPDLWAYARALGLEAAGYRVWFAPERLSPAAWVRAAAARFVAARLLGCDYADNIALVARKPAGTQPGAGPTG